LDISDIIARLYDEHRLGSTLYFVYTRAQSPELSSDVLRLELTYW
jgi:hypothetical protein